MADTDDNFFSRWSRRKVQLREGQPVAPVPEAPSRVDVPLPATASLAPLHAAATPAAIEKAPATPAAPPLPTLADVAELTNQSDYTRFVARGVTPEVKNAALKKLFTDPQFNVMDGLDIYIDDYGKPDPLPEGMLRKMVQSKMLRLFDDDPPEPATAEEGVAAAVTPATPETLATAASPAGMATAGEVLPPTEGAPAALTDSDNDPVATNLIDPHEDTAVQLQPDAAAGRSGPEQGAREDAGRQH